VGADRIGNGEFEKVMYSFCRDVQPLFPALSSAT